MPDEKPQTFRKRPVVVQAMRWDGSYESQSQIVTWTNGVASGWFDGAYYLSIDTLEGAMRAEVGDWIIRGVQGEFYPCKPDIFDATYEPVNRPAVAAIGYRSAKCARCHHEAQNHGDSWGSLHCLQGYCGCPGLLFLPHAECDVCGAPAIPDRFVDMCDDHWQEFNNWRTTRPGMGDGDDAA